MEETMPIRVKIQFDVPECLKVNPLTGENRSIENIKQAIFKGAFADTTTNRMVEVTPIKPELEQQSAYNTLTDIFNILNWNRFLQINGFLSAIDLDDVSNALEALAKREQSGEIKIMETASIKDYINSLL